MIRKLIHKNKLRKQFSKIYSPISLNQASKQTQNYCQYSNDIILSLSLMGDQNANEERLIREIMSVEDLSWKDAQPIFAEMLIQNRKYNFLIKLPYNIGIFSALTVGFMSYPFIFNFECVNWFNQIYVHETVPPMEELRTPFEVSGWAWNWMEPVLGQCSFFLLNMQFARNQMKNIGWMPYTAWIKQKRANYLIQKYDKYNKGIVKKWSLGDYLDKRKNNNETI